MNGAIRVAALALLFAAGAAGATDYLQDGQRLVLKASSGGGRLTFVSRTPAVALPTADPRTVGATLVVVNPVSSESATLTLPASGWSANGTGTQYKFANRTAPAGSSPV